MSTLQRAVGDLLSILVINERDLEIMRLILAEQPDFEPYAAFRRLDVQTKDHLSAGDLKAFMDLSPAEVSDRDFANLVRVWDVDGDGLVSYTEFLTAVLPKTSPALRAIATSRSQFLMEGLPVHVEYPLLRLLERQIQTIKIGDEAKMQLVSLAGFSAMDAYETLDPHGVGYVSFDALVSFFQSLKKEDPDTLAEFILRLFDTEKNGRFGYSHFVEGLNPVDIEVREQALQCLRNYNSSHRQRFTPRKPQSVSPTKGKRTAKTSIYSTPQKGSKHATPFRKSTAAFLGESVRLRSTKKLNSRNNPRLAKVLLEQLALEKEIESDRQKLALRTDFSISALMRRMPGSDGHVSTRMLGQVLESLDVHPAPREVELLSKLLDKDEDGWMSALDFSDLLVPRQKEHRRVLQSRVKSASAFSEETKRCLAEVFRHLLDTELTAELLREQVSKSRVESGFQALDRGRKGYLLVSDFRFFLQLHGHFLTEKELAGLMGRYDRNKDGRVTLREFALELSPKC